MAEGQTAHDSEQFKNDLDAGIAGVMPPTWKGHGRMKIHEKGLAGKKRTFAKKLFARLKEKHPDKSSKVLAKKAIEMAEKKF